MGLNHAVTDVKARRGVECVKCRWPFPNPHPSARHRRAHKKVCGTLQGYELLDLKMTEKADSTLQNSQEKCFQEEIKELEFCSISEIKEERVDGSKNEGAIEEYKGEIKVVEEEGMNESKHLGNMTEKADSTSQSSQEKCFQAGEKEVEFNSISEIVEECDEGSGKLKSISPKVTLRELLQFRVGDESYNQNDAAEKNNQVLRQFGWGASASSTYESSDYEGFSFQQNAQSDFEAEAKKANLKNLKSEAEKYDMDNFVDKKRRTFRKLFEPVAESNKVDNKSQWRKKIEGIFGKVFLRKKKPKSETRKSEVESKPLACCYATKLIRSHKRKMKEWEFQLHDYVTKYSSTW